jgi:hypothetical protein
VAFFLVALLFLVLDELVVNDVGQPPLEGAYRLHRCLALGDPLVVVRPPVGGVPQLDDRHDVQHSVDPPVSGPGEPLPAVVR